MTSYILKNTSIKFLGSKNPQVHHILALICLYNCVFNFGTLVSSFWPTVRWSTPGQCVAHCCARGFFLHGSVEQSSSVRGKRHTTRVFYDVLNSVIDFMMMKRCHMPGHGPRAIKWRNITNAILYIGLMTWYHESLHLEKIP